MTGCSITDPTLSDIEEIARDAFQTIPAALRQHAEDVVIHVTDFPDRSVCSALNLDNPFDLLGLYQGTPIGEKETAATPQDIDRIFLYRRPLLEFWRTGADDLSAVVRHVLVHEIGHHFGFSDDDMAALEAATDTDASTSST